MSKNSFKIPTISVRNNNGSIQIRFTLGKQKYSLSGLGKYTDPLALANAQKICKEIELDFLVGRFNGDIQVYYPSPKLNSEIKLSQTITLKEVWEAYKNAYLNQIKPSSQYAHWKAVDRLLGRLKNDLLQSQNAHKITQKALEHYSANTLLRCFTYICSASKWAHEAKMIDENYWGSIKKGLPKAPPNKRKEQYYSSEEIQIILEAFESNRFLNPSSRKEYSHSYYKNFIEFLFLTGCRPQDAIALTWDKIYPTYILFSEAVTLGQRGTNKTNTIRKFPINSKLKELMGRIQEYNHSTFNSLVFPSHSGKYLCLGTVRSVWKKVISGLISEGRIDKYLPPYNLRNSAITLYSQAGVQDKDLARMMGTSTRMIDEHYKGIRDAEKIQLPEI